MHGIAPFRRNLEEKLALARWAAERLREIPGIEIVAEPQLSILAFRWRTRPGAEPPRSTARTGAFSSGSTRASAST